MLLRDHWIICCYLRVRLIWHHLLSKLCWNLFVDGYEEEKMHQCGCLHIVIKKDQLSFSLAGQPLTRGAGLRDSYPFWWRMVFVLTLQSIFQCSCCTKVFVYQSCCSSLTCRVIIRTGTHLNVFKMNSNNIAIVDDIIINSS